MTEAPLYRQIAEQWRRKIQSGDLRAGAQLPTEMTLCEVHGISRHTAREALRILTEDGLIVRRRGAGTVVAEAPAPAFAQTLGDFGDILQYAREAKFICNTADKAAAADLEALGLTGSFRRFTGLRQVGIEPPLALTRVYVSGPVAPELATIRTLNGSVSEWIEANHGVAITRVTQRMEAVALGRDDAATLGVLTDSPALRTIRRYRDADGNIIQLSESLHPAGRFAYEMRLERGV